MQRKQAFNSRRSSRWWWCWDPKWISGIQRGQECKRFRSHIVDGSFLVSYDSRSDFVANETLDQIRIEAAVQLMAPYRGRHVEAGADFALRCAMRQLCDIVNEAE